MAVKPFEIRGKVSKVDSRRGIVIGWGMVSKEDGDQYFDTDGEAVEDDEIVKSACDFMLHSGQGDEMHEGPATARVVFAFPLVEDICEALGIVSKRHGLVIGYMPNDREMLKKFESGEYTGFSIQGTAKRVALAWAA